MSIAMEYRGPALAAAVGDWRATFFEGQAFLSNPGGTDWAVSVVDGVAYDGTETLVTLRSAVLTPSFAAAQVGRNPAGDVQAHAGRHKAGGLDPLAHADLAGVAAGTMTHAQIDAYLDNVSELLSGLDADLAAEAAALAAHKTATSAHTAAQVGLGNVTNDAQIPLAQRGMPGGVPDLDGDGLVVQDPASAAETPGPGKIPRAGLSGLLDAWISAASTAVAGLVQLATNAVAWAGTSTSQVITAAALWYVLTLATRLRISTNTTIYVSPTGSDSTGAGTAGSPYASIGKALLSIAGKSIDGGVTVTIQCADGTYSIASTIVIDHPDADKIQILGNTSAETTVAIASIDTTAKTITVVGNYVSNADATKNIQVGDIIGLLGDVRTVAISSISGNVSTVSSDPTTKMTIGDTIYILNGTTAANIKSYVVTGLTSTTVTVSAAIPSTTVGGASLTVTNQGAYLVSGVSYNGTNTVITCSSETIASATVGGGSVRIMPSNRCVLVSSVGALKVLSKLSLIDGIRINCTNVALSCQPLSKVVVGSKMIFYGSADASSYAISARSGSSVEVAGAVIKSCQVGVNPTQGCAGLIFTSSAPAAIIDSCLLGLIANSGAYSRANSAFLLVRNNTTDFSPAINTEGNARSYIERV